LANSGDWPFDFVHLGSFAKNPFIASISWGYFGFTWGIG